MQSVKLEKNTCLVQVAEREAEQEPGQEMTSTQRRAAFIFQLGIICNYYYVIVSKYYLHAVMLPALKNLGKKLNEMEGIVFITKNYLQYQFYSIIIFITLGNTIQVCKIMIILKHNCFVKLVLIFQVIKTQEYILNNP